jgi:hypothetical protein
MKIHRGLVSIVAGIALAGSWPAGAQGLGGGLGGAVGGAAGGMLGAQGGTLGGSFGGAGNAAGQGNAGIGSGRLGSVRDHGAQAAEGTKSRVDSAHGAAATDVQAAKAGGRAAGQQTSSAAQGAPPASGPGTPVNGGDLSLGGGASAEKHAFGRRAAAGGSGESATSVDDSGVLNASNGQAEVSVEKEQPAQPAPESDAK